MKKFIIISILCVFCFSSNANEFSEYINVQVNEMVRDGDFKKMAQCYKVPESKAIAAYRGAVVLCMKSHSEASSQFDACFQENFARALDKQPLQLIGCNNKFSDINIGGTANHIEKFSEVHGGDDNPFLGMSYRQIEALNDQEYEALLTISGRKLEMLETQALQQWVVHMPKEISNDDISRVSLPIYKDARVMSHFPQGIEFDGNKTLPVITLESTATLSQVTAFYRSELSDFEYRESIGISQFAKKLPAADLDLMDFLILYSKIPHVSVRQSIKANTVTIEIAYQ